MRLYPTVLRLGARVLPWLLLALSAPSAAANAAAGIAGQRSAAGSGVLAPGTAGASTQRLPPGSSSTPQPTTAPYPAGSLCRETLPEGRARPKLTEKFPARSPSGYAAQLEVTVEHEAAETVMPGGDQIQLGTKEAGELEHQGFILPSPAGPSKMRIERHDSANPPTTKVDVPLLLLAKDPEKHTLTLPSLPITVGRANGEVFTLCTAPHEVTVEDPTSSTPEPKPKPNPPPRRQLEEWTALKHGVMIGTVALLAGMLLAALFMLWRHRPKRAVPPPPPRPPWEIAFEELQQLRRGDLIARQRYSEHYDQASDTVRKYLGSRFGFDGLESTTRELLSALGDSHVDVGTMSAIELYLCDADLVKFANRTPTEAECWLALDRAEGFVRSTLPAPEPATPEPDQKPREQASS
jgi:hypothetical protein